MTLKIYGTLGFTSTQRVLVVLKESDAEYEFHHIDFGNGEHKQPSFLAMQPFGQIPVLIDGDFILYESRSICKYIVSKFAPEHTRLLPRPDDLRATAIYDQAASAELFHYDKFASVIVWEKHIAPMYGNLPNMELVKTARENFSKALDAYEVILSKQYYLAGEEMTLIDIFHLPYTNLLFECHEGELIASRPHVAAWWQRISQLQSWKNVIGAA